MNFGEIIKLMALNTGGLNNGKNLFGSLISDGSLIVIGVIAGLAILAGVIIFLRKKKKDKKEYETAESIGIRRERAANYIQTKEGVDRCYCAMSEAINHVRCNNADDIDLERFLKENR